MQTLVDSLTCLLGHKLSYFFSMFRTPHLVILLLNAFILDKATKI